MSGKSLLKKVLGVAGNFIPALNVINQFLPSDKQLPEDAEEDAIAYRYDRLPVTQQAKVDKEIEQELGMEKEHTSQLEILAKADGPGSSTRPKGVMMMMWLLIVETLLFTAYLFFVVIREGTEGLDSLQGLWVVFGIFTGTPATVILTYYNARTKEKRTRYAVAHGQSANLVSGIMGLFKK
jgi:hypothetical protein